MGTILLICSVAFQPTLPLVALIAHSLRKSRQGNSSFWKNSGFVDEEIIFVYRLQDADMRNRLPFFFQRFIQPNTYLLNTLIGLIGFITFARATPVETSKAPTVLTVSVSSATVCAGTSTTLTVAGCPADGTIRWSTTQTGSVIAVVPQQTTSYSVTCTEGTSTTATNTNPTVTSASATIQVYRPIVVSLEYGPPTCNGNKDGRIVVNTSGGVGALQYQISGQAFQALNEFGALRAGTYPIAVKDAIGCTVQTNAELTQPPALSANVAIINTKCVGGGDGALVASASGGIGDYRYSLLDLTSPQTGGTFINLVANTTYTLIISDKNGCVLYKPATVGQATPIAIKLTPAPARCLGSADGSVTVSATGGAGTFQYQIGNGAFQTGTQFTGLAAATYDVTVQDGYGCQGKQTVTVAQPAALTLTTVVKSVNCLGPNTGAISATTTGGTGSTTYQIANQPAPAGNVFNGLAVGTYTVVSTDANGCTSFASVAVGKADPLKIQTSVLPASCCNCPTGAVKITNTGGTGTGLQYQIIGRPYQTNSQIDKLPPSSYRLRVTDDGGCTDSTVATVTNANPITLTAGTTKNVSCAGGQDGEATVQATGGAGPFMFYWQTERRDTLTNRAATQTSLGEGAYTVSVRDANQCTAPTIFVALKAINPLPTPPTISQVANGTLVANQTTNIQWYVRIGTDPVKPVPNATTATLTPYASGQYYATFTQNGCASLPSNVINFILLSLTEPSAPLAVRVMPNPIVDRLRLEIEQPERSAVRVHLLDGSGRIVGSYQWPAFTGKQQTEWPVTGVSTGAYLLKVASESRQSVLRVVVQ